MEGWDNRYLDPRKAAKSWRPKSGSMSPGLKRARQPFLFKNIITGVLLGAFVVGVYTYSIRAVKQDEFDDIDEEAKANAKLREKEEQTLARTPVLTVDEEKNTMEAAARAVATSIKSTGSGVKGTSETLGSTSIPNSVVEAVSAAQASRTRGILPKYLPGLLDPTSKTLVSGAPSVDSIGTVGNPKR